MVHEVSTSAHTGFERIRSIKRVLWIVLLLNISVAITKFLFGYFSQTTSIQADGIHSIFDSAGNIVGIIGISIAARPADYGHPYGHAKFETYASAIIGVLLLAAAWEVGSTAIGDLIHGTADPDVSLLSFLIMLGTLVVNLSVTTYERRESKRLSSEILGADSRHTLSDVIVTCGVIVGLIFIKLGYTIADPIMSLVVTVAILYTAYEVFKQANASLSDSARLPVEDVSDCVMAIPGVCGCHEIRTRGTESEVYLDLHVLVDPLMSVKDAHMLADDVESRVRETFPSVIDVVIHLEPDDPHQQSVTAHEEERNSEELKKHR